VLRSVQQIITGQKAVRMQERLLMCPSSLRSVGAASVQCAHNDAGNDTNGPIVSRFRLLIGLVLASVVGASAVAAQTKPKILETGIERPTSAIFIGNSFFYYNNGIDGHFVRLLRSADANYKFRATMVTIGGSGADWHDVDSYFRPNAIGTYSFDDNNNIIFNKIDRLFDLAILMDCSQCPIHPQLKSIFFEFTKKHSDTIRKNGALPVFFMSWAYADKPEMVAKLADAYTEAGNTNGALVIPAGLAFAKALEWRPKLNLHAADKRHPSLAGTYLAVCTVYASLFKKSPVGIKYTAGLDEPTAKLLQSVAWETVQNYFGRAVSSK
jgi:hypothetical protein